MRSFTTSIFLLGLLFVCHGAEFMAKESVPEATLLAELDNDHFGSTILSTISVHLSAEAPVEQITALLENVRANIVADQKSSNQQFASLIAGCHKEIPEYKRNVAYHSAQLSSYKKLRSDNQALYTKTAQSQKLTNNDIAANNKRFSEGRLQRKANHQEYLRRLVEGRNAIIIIDEAVTLVEHIRQGTSFVQLESHFEKVTEKLQAHVKANSLYSPIISALAQLSTNADQSVVRRILGLLASMRRSILAGKKTDTINEARQIITWKRTRRNLEQERKNLLQKKKQLDNAAKMFRRIIRQSSKKVEEHSVSLLKYQATLKSQTKHCKVSSHQHVVNTKERKRNLAIIVKLQKFFSKKMGHVKSYLKKRLNH